MAEVHNGKTGDVAKRLGLNVETLRYYERIQLISAPSRTLGKHRVYSEDDIRRLVFIKRARELGFSLEEVRELLKQIMPEHFSCEKIHSITRVALERARARLTALQRAEQALTEALERCPSHSSACCRVLEELFREHAAEIPHGEKAELLRTWIAK